MHKALHIVLRRKQQGFTLIEIIIALLVISVALGAVINTTSSSVRHGTHIKEKTIALWVAQNHIAEITMGQQWLSSGTNAQEAKMAGKAWFIQNKITQTPDQNIRRMDISVYSDKKIETKLVTLTAYISKPFASSQTDDGLQTNVK